MSHVIFTVTDQKLGNDQKPRLLVILNFDTCPYPEGSQEFPHKPVVLAVDGQLNSIPRRRCQHCVAIDPKALIANPRRQDPTV